MNLRSGNKKDSLLETAIDALGLSEENRQLAEEYLDGSQPEDQELLKKAAREDLSSLSQEQKRKSMEYIDYCRKRGLKDSFGRYVHFVAAVAGSTAWYALVNWGFRTQGIEEFLTAEQIAAIKAEGIVWNSYLLNDVGNKLGTKDKNVLKRAMDLCYHKSDNAKVLLAGLCLRYAKPEKQQGNLLKNLFLGRKEKEGQWAIVAKFLEDNVIASIPNMFPGNRPDDEEMKKLKSFVKEAALDAPMPDFLAGLCKGKPVSEYLVILLSGAAFLGFQHSARLFSFLRLCVAVLPETALNSCLQICGKTWFAAHIQELEEYLPLPAKTYVEWCVKHREGHAVARMAKKCPEEVRDAAVELSADEYIFLFQCVKAGNLKLYHEMDGPFSGEFKNKAAAELATHYMAGQEKAKKYLLGEEKLDAVLPFVKEWRKTYCYWGRDYDKVQKLRQGGQEQMYRRIVVLEALCMHGVFFDYGAVQGAFQTAVKKGGNRWILERQQIENSLEIFDLERLPVPYQLDALAAMHDNLYFDRDKTAFLKMCVKILSFKRNAWKEEIERGALEGTPVVRYLCIQVMDVFWQDSKKCLLSCAKDSSKQVRELLVSVYAGHKEWEEDIKEMLESKKSKEREMAALVMKQWGSANYREEFLRALEKERGKAVKELLEQCLGIQGEDSAKAGEEGLEDLAKRILKGGKKRKIAWVYEGEGVFPQVHTKNGGTAKEDDMAAILAAYADMPIPGFNQDAAKLAKALDPKELASYMACLFDRWLAIGAEAKKKWVLYAASIHGGEEIVSVIHHQIQEWPKVSRGAMAAEAVKALALNGSTTALLLVDQISRKFKFRQVKNAAGEALSYAAAQLGLSRAELEDRIVPDLGFDEHMGRTFDYGPRNFQVYLNTALELEIYNQDGKKLKNLPAPGKRDDEEKAKAAYEAFKWLKKQWKAVAANQKLRLEQALSGERRWEPIKWKELFVKNPVMHQFAIGLIWGWYEGKELKATFRYMEDGSFNTVEEEEYELPEQGGVGLVHPIELDEEMRAAWKEQLEDYEVTQPIEQLNRPVYRILEEEKGQKELVRFGGKLLNGLSLSGKLQSQGWYRGSVLDGGCYDTFYREDGDIGAELRFSGCYVGDENEEVTVYDVVFYKAGTVKRGSYVYDEIKKDRRYRLDEISPRYFSEVILQLTRATASSQEQLAYPQCKE